MGCAVINSFYLPDIGTHTDNTLHIHPGCAKRGKRRQARFARTVPVFCGFAVHRRKVQHVPLGRVPSPKGSDTLPRGTRNHSIVFISSPQPTSTNGASPRARAQPARGEGRPKRAFYDKSSNSRSKGVSSTPLNSRSSAHFRIFAHDNASVQSISSKTAAKYC